MGSRYWLLSRRKDNNIGLVFYFTNTVRIYIISELTATSARNWKGAPQNELVYIFTSCTPQYLLLTGCSQSRLCKMDLWFNWVQWSWINFVIRFWGTFAVFVCIVTGYSSNFKFIYKKMEKIPGYPNMFSESSLWN